MAPQLREMRFVSRRGVRCECESSGGRSKARSAGLSLCMTARWWHRKRALWLAARRMDWQNGHQTHTGAVFVIVDSKPVRASATDAMFFVQWIDNLIRQT